MAQKTISAMGFVWYTQQNYPRVLEVMEDAHLLPPTFEKWLYSANKGFERAKRNGVVPVKAHLDPESFVSWCLERGLNVNADARMQFAAAIARAMYQQGGG